MAAFNEKIPPSPNNGSGSSDSSSTNEKLNIFKNHKVTVEHFIPKDKAAWMEVIKNLVKQHCKITYLNESDVEQFVHIFKTKICSPNRYKYKIDPDLPQWYYWTTDEVGKWIVKAGYGEFQEMFLVNDINGRKLCGIDASALNKMGVKYFKDIKNITKKIRSLIGFHYPNSLRSLSRKLPFEEFLKSNYLRGKTYDMRTFKNFCSKNDYDYEHELDIIDKPLKEKSIPVYTCPVSITPRGPGIKIIKSNDSIDSKTSLELAPTVEYIVRTVNVRNQIVDEILHDFLRAVFSKDTGDPGESISRLALGDSLRCKMTKAYTDLGIYDAELCGLDQLNFSAVVAKELFNEILKTKLLFEDIDELKHSIEEEVPDEVLKKFAKTAQDFLEKIAPTAAIMGLMSLDLKLLLFENAVDRIEQYFYLEDEFVCEE